MKNTLGTVKILFLAAFLTLSIPLSSVYAAGSDGYGHIPVDSSLTSETLSSAAGGGLVMYAIGSTFVVSGKVLKSKLGQ